MKQLLLIIALCVLIASLPWLNAAETPKDVTGFRGFEWGTSYAEVKKRESLELVHASSEGLAYKITIANIPMAAVYFFDSAGQLNSAGYNLSEPHSDPRQRLNDYEKLAAYFANQYGQPHSDRMDWNNEQYKDQPEQYALAVSVGDLTLEKRWIFGSTAIVLSAHGRHQQIALSANYRRLQKAGVDLKSKRQEALDQL